MVFDNTFVCTGTGKSYYKRDQLHSGTINVIYFTSCSKCLEQYVGSAVKFKTRLNIYKSDIKTKSERCGSARYFNSKCYHDTNPLQYLKIQLISRCIISNLENIEDSLREREKYCQSQLLTIAKTMISILDLYSSKRKRCRQRLFITFNRDPYFICTIMSIILKFLYALTKNLIDILIVVIINNYYTYYKINLHQI